VELTSTFLLDKRLKDFYNPASAKIVCHVVFKLNRILQLMTDVRPQPSRAVGIDKGMRL